MEHTKKSNKTIWLIVAVVVLILFIINHNKTPSPLVNGNMGMATPVATNSPNMVTTRTVSPVSKATVLATPMGAAAKY